MKEKIKNLTKEKIFNYCIKDFAKNGYSNVGIRKISKETGLSTGAIYYNFSSKEKIAWFLYDSATELVLNKIKTAIKKSTNGIEAIKSIISVLFQLTEENLHLMEYVLYVKHKDFLPGVPPICSSKPFEYIKRFIKTKIKEGVFEDMDMVIASSLIMGPIIRVIQLKMDGILKEDLNKYTEPLFNGIVKSVYRNQI